MIRTQWINESYDVLELFCELIGTRVPVMAATKCYLQNLYILAPHSRQCSPRHASSNLHSDVGGFASPRKGITDLGQELGNKYGKELVEEAAENCNNCVHPKVCGHLYDLMSILLFFCF